MILDNETQRTTLIQALDLMVPRVVTGADPQSLQNMQVLADVRRAVENANVASEAGGPKATATGGARGK